MKVITMDPISITVFLEYIYSKFAVTFILSIIGVSIREMLGNAKSKSDNKHTRIHLGKVITLTLFSTVVMCAAGDYIHVSFSIYVLLCILFGMWSRALIRIVTDNRFIKTFVVKFIGSISPPAGQSISDALDATEEDQNEERKVIGDEPKK